MAAPAAPATPVKAEALALSVIAGVTLLGAWAVTAAVAAHPVLAILCGALAWAYGAAPASTIVASAAALVPLLLLFVVRHTWLALVSLLTALAAYRWGQLQTR
jgi:hypothetical protein